MRMKNVIMIINDNKNRRVMDLLNLTTSKQLLLEKTVIFKMMRENKCEDGKTSSSKT